jgi:hypothetical protein
MKVPCKNAGRKRQYIGLQLFIVVFDLPFHPKIIAYLLYLEECR